MVVGKVMAAMAINKTRRVVAVATHQTEMKMKRKMIMKGKMMIMKKMIILVARARLRIRTR